MILKRRGFSARRQRQWGYMLLDTSLALLVGTTAAVAGIAYTIDKRAEDQARAQGLAMVTLQGAVNQYLTDHFGELVKPGGGSVPGVASPLSPTVTELRAVGALKDPFSGLAYNGGNYRVLISTFPAGCVAPACNLDGLVWIDRPVVDWRNNVDFPRLGVAVRTIGADGAMSTSANPATLLGMQGKWNTANPGGAQAGILGARTGYNSAAYAQFYRRDGSLPMTSDVAAGGYNINNAKAVNAQQVNLPAGNSLNIAGVQWYGDGSNSAIRMNGNLYLQGPNGSGARSLIAQDGTFAGNASVAGTASITQTNTSNANVWGTASINQTNTSNANVWGTASINQMNASNANIWGNQTTYGNHWVNGALVAGNMVYLPALAWAGWGCGGNGITTDPNGQLLSCQGGVWQTSGGGIKNYADFDWFPGYGTFGTGLPYSNWTCALSRVGGKYAGGGESVQVIRDGGSGTWIVIGSSGSDNSGAFARITCAQI
ncbi:hypothetical protein [Cupriavidus sp. TMH.W2]|uniref:hypothetical protein n=1 Tax=Cupriavidus sp. TMH.W2 TaxID=3434465 RepID=UPI003D77CBA0